MLDISHISLFGSSGSGYFMHFNTGTAHTGDTALLESRLLYPKHGHQCLQFFYYNSGSQTDTLKIYVRQYDDANPDGKLLYVTTIDGEYDRILQLLKSAITVALVKSDHYFMCCDRIPPGAVATSPRESTRQD